MSTSILFRITAFGLLCLLNYSDPSYALSGQSIKKVHIRQAKTKQQLVNINAKMETLALALAQAKAAAHLSLVIAS